MHTNRKPIILSSQVDQEQAFYELHIPDDLVYFDGHFDGVAVLAGVVQVDWVMYLAEQAFSIDKLSFQKIDQLKFTNVLRPNMTVRVVLKLVNCVLSFQYVNEDIIYSSGKLRQMP